MICLDTNYLIRGVAEGSSEAAEMIKWAESGETLVTSMLAWFEFLCGPVTDAQVTTMDAFLSEVIPFAEIQAVEAARLFNAINRKRPLRVDAMIAATAIVARAGLATNNRGDFKPFEVHGLKLV